MLFGLVLSISGVFLSGVGLYGLARTKVIPCWGALYFSIVAALMLAMFITAPLPVKSVPAALFVWAVADAAVKSFRNSQRKVLLRVPGATQAGLVVAISKCLRSLSINFSLTEKVFTLPDDDVSLSANESMLILEYRRKPAWWKEFLNLMRGTLAEINKDYVNRKELLITVLAGIAVISGGIFVAFGN